MSDPIEKLFRQATPITHPKAKDPGFHPGERQVIREGSIRARGHHPMHCDVIWERDIPVTLRDGVTIYTDLWRPAHATGPLPVIAAWSPYGKLSGSQSVEQIPGRAGIPRSATTGWESFEAPDPGYWCNAGYAVLTPDIRGVFRSEGDILFWGQQCAEDGYDFVEWAAEQEWSDGTFAFTGNSQLSILQWFIAALRPPHLTAIAPWEALIDMYRNDVCMGGVPDAGFNDSIIAETYGQGRIEDVPEMLKLHPLFDDYWAEKIPDVSAIDVPAYVVASWTNPVHSRGTLQAWERLTTPERWLRIHNTMEWPDYFSDAAVTDLRRFFDHTLKGIDNGWEHTPQVRLSILDPGGTDTVDRAYAEFPIASTRHTPFYLDAASTSMNPTLSPASSTVSYASDDNASRVRFTHSFDEDTEVAGHTSLRLWVEVDGHDDADIWAWVRKLDAAGQPLTTTIIPMKPLAEKALRAFATIKPVRERMPAGALYGGPWGRQRVSLRALDAAASAPGLPVHRFDTVEPVSAGEIVPVEISLWPLGMRFRRGEQLCVELSGFNSRGPNLPGIPLPVNHNRGRHIIHTGGAYDSHLLLPVVS